MYSPRTNFVVFDKTEYLWLMSHLEALGYHWNSSHTPTHYNDNRDYYTHKRLCINSRGCLSCGHSGDNEVILVRALMNYKKPSIFKSTVSNPEVVNGYKVSHEAIDEFRNGRYVNFSLYRNIMVSHTDLVVR